jgi:hypothetical protein
MSCGILYDFELLLNHLGPMLKWTNEMILAWYQCNMLV